MNPKISIVMATYNQARYIEASLDSIRNQRFQDFELIVVDDGCTDDTSVILRAYQESFPFTLIDQPNQGQARALNNGFAMARGEYLTWTSSDNILLPSMLETLVAALDANPKLGLVYSDWDVIDAEGHTTAHVKSIPFDRWALLRDNFVNASFLYRRTCLDQVGMYDVEIGKKFDWDYWLRVSKAFPCQHVAQTLYLYRRHQASSHMQPDADLHYQRFATVWKRREPSAWYGAKLRAYWQRKRYGQETRLVVEPVNNTLTGGQRERLS